MKDIHQLLSSKILEFLIANDEKGSIVITENAAAITEDLVNTIQSAYSGEIFSPQELFLFSQLAYECSTNKQVFQGELKSVTGYDSEQLTQVAKKLRTLSGV